MRRKGDDGVLPRTPRSPCEADGALSFAVIYDILAATTYPTTPANPLSYPA